MNLLARLLIGSALLGSIVVFSGCTRHKKGADAFEHYFEIRLPERVELVQAHWAGFYYPFGLDSEQMLLEFTAPEQVIQDLLFHDKDKGRTAISAEEREQIFGSQTGDANAVKRGLELAPEWFQLPDKILYAISFAAGQSAVVRFSDEPVRFRMIIYDHGCGHIFVDHVAHRVFVTQVRGGKLF
ncbi:MAG: hypothetical protein PSV13_03435 [Lacunisphaera sp.]|nr:hypothetical protein [Lacunisphaera sp.]